MKMKYKFSEGQYEEIKKVRKQNRDKQTDKRLQVLELRCEGKGLEEIARITGFHRSHVSNLIRKYFEEGLEAVSEKHYQGNRRNMSIEEEARFLEQFREMASRNAPVWEIVSKEKLQELLGSPSPWPWYGQLMRNPQIMAYFLQMNFWLSHYHVDIQ